MTCLGYVLPVARVPAWRNACHLPRTTTTCAISGCTILHWHYLAPHTRFYAAAYTTPHLPSPTRTAAKLRTTHTRRTFPLPSHAPLLPPHRTHAAAPHPCCRGVHAYSDFLPMVLCPAPTHVPDYRSPSPDTTCTGIPRWRTDFLTATILLPPLPRHSWVESHLPGIILCFLGGIRCILLTLMLPGMVSIMPGAYTFAWAAGHDTWAGLGGGMGCGGGGDGPTCPPFPLVTIQRLYYHTYHAVRASARFFHTTAPLPHLTGYHTRLPRRWRMTDPFPDTTLFAGTYRPRHAYLFLLLRSVPTLLPHHCLVRGFRLPHGCVPRYPDRSSFLVTLTRTYPTTADIR